ncbi:hypothetical protein V3H18_03780 [Methylocystis sp. 9N]|uniref:Uncharacterized protein n=1 Tax=Methylocystis borbori TaxID=3118750 RepID=A0ABU7XEQ9_9HYPH
MDATGPGRRPAMIARWVILLLGLIAIAILFTLLSGEIGGERRRYRLTVELLTPAGPRTGASVIEARKAWQLPLMGASNVRYTIDGEAVRVDLGDGRVLYALLMNEATQFELPWFGARRGSVAPALPRSYSREEQAALWAELVRSDAMVTLDAQDYPQLVTLANNSDPSSLAIVPTANVGTALGRSHQLARITLQPTGDPVTHTLRQRLPWLAEGAKPRLPGGVRTRDFVRE